MKKKIIAAVMSAACILASVPVSPVLADGQKVVTLGADLSEEQKQAILRYFGVEGQNLQTLTITNQDEREHLGSYVPLEQIGTRTYSCAYVSPTNSGGIQVKTANLSWVTSNMIAATLSTSGVVNCDVLAASPFEVSGTGALTGILMAYESAVGTTLDEAKKEVATQELITTTTIANNIGPVEATEIVNETKTQVIEGNVVSDNDIDVIINEVAAQEKVTLSEEDHALLSDLMQQIAQQQYDYDEMKETLDRIEANMEEQKQQQTETTSSETPAQTEATPTDSAPAETETPETVDPDSILMNTDDSALGDSVIIDATDDAAMPETEAPAQSESAEQTEAPVQSENAETEFDISISDSYGAEGTSETDASSEQTEAPAEQTEAPAQSESAEQTEASAQSETQQTETAPESETAQEETAAAETAITTAEMVFSPVTSNTNNFTVYPAGIDELTVYFQRTDIAAGTGTVSVVNSADNSTVDTITVSDTARTVIEPMTEEELLEKGWSEGTKATLYLAAPLAQNSAYYVTLSQDAFASADGTAHSEEVSDPSIWSIQTSEFGFGLDKSKTGGLTAGSTVSAQIMMDGTAATYAAIENVDPAMVTFDQGEFTASGTCNATFNASGTTTFQVSFYDEAGTQLYTIDYTANVK
ncbi:MAG TPA: DUF1002 domain-containing protein [Candidatus Choladousia intestinipullorum]|nr:DUF1002 domain-containing protein [Candidatus Choladousia intestinipullorum]